MSCLLRVSVMYIICFWDGDEERVTSYTLYVPSTKMDNVVYFGCSGTTKG